jgi:hypothetical protein
VKYNNTWNTIHKTCWKCPPFSWMQAFTRFTTFCSTRRRDLWFMLAVASDMFVFMSCVVWGLLSLTCPLTRPHKNKSGGDRAGDLGGQRPMKSTFLQKILSIMPCSFVRYGKWLHLAETTHSSRWPPAKRPTALKCRDNFLLSQCQRILDRRSCIVRQRNTACSGLSW